MSLGIVPATSNRQKFGMEEKKKETLWLNYICSKCFLYATFTEVYFISKSFVEDLDA